MSIEPDLPIVGFRVWQMRHTVEAMTLISPFRGTVWDSPEQTMFCPQGHTAPQLDCDCGLHAAESLDNPKIRNWIGTRAQLSRSAGDTQNTRCVEINLLGDDHLLVIAVTSSIAGLVSGGTELVMGDGEWSSSTMRIEALGDGGALREGFLPELLTGHEPFDLIVTSNDGTPPQLMSSESPGAQDILHSRSVVNLECFDRTAMLRHLERFGVRIVRQEWLPKVASEWGLLLTKSDLLLSHLYREMEDEEGQMDVASHLIEMLRNATPEDIPRLMDVGRNFFQHPNFLLKLGLGEALIRELVSRDSERSRFAIELLETLLPQADTMTVWRFVKEIPLAPDTDTANAFCGPLVALLNNFKNLEQDFARSTARSLIPRIPGLLTAASADQRHRLGPAIVAMTSNGLKGKVPDVRARTMAILPQLLTNEDTVVQDCGVQLLEWCLRDPFCPLYAAPEVSRVLAVIPSVIRPALRNVLKKSSDRSIG